jgi:uncharacterized protein
VLDTGVLLAALDAADPDHEACAALIAGTTESLVIPVLVLSELDYWCQKRLPPNVWLSLLEDLFRGAYKLEALTTEDVERCHDLQSIYADLKIGVVDASVLAVVERLGEKKVATLDHRHFGTMRPLHTPVLRLLPD